MGLSVWHSSGPSVLVDVLASKAAAKLAAAAEEAEESPPADEPPPPPPPPITDPIEAALAILADDDVQAAVGGAAPSEDFAAVCEQLAITIPHPAVMKALSVSGVFSLRSWKADLPSLCALLAVLSKHSGVTAARFWGCGLDASALELLARGLPSSVDSLSLEADALTDHGSALGALEEDSPAPPEHDEGYTVVLALRHPTHGRLLT